MHNMFTPIRDQILHSLHTQSVQSIRLLSYTYTHMHIEPYKPRMTMIGSCTLPAEPRKWVRPSRVLLHMESGVDEGEEQAMELEEDAQLAVQVACLSWV